ENHLREAASPGDDVLHVLDRYVAVAEPRVRLGGVCLERPRAPDASPYGMVQLGLAGKRSEHRVEFSGQQTVEERHGYKLASPFLLHPLQHRRREQLGGPWHHQSVPHPSHTGRTDMPATRPTTTEADLYLRGAETVL